MSRYRELLEQKQNGKLNSNDEDEYLSLYKVLSSYGMVEKLPQSMLGSEFEQDLGELLKVGDAILKEYKK